MQDELRILLVEDSEDDASLILRFAKSNAKSIYHERVQTESAMRQALSTGQWDLIISDYSLPSFSGLGAIGVLKESKHNIPFIIVSGAIGEDVAVNVLKQGATDYVLKSNLGRLSTSIEHALRENRAEAEKNSLMRKLEQSQKMEAVGRLAGGLAHDVNNVLGAITLYAELALDQIDNSGLADAKKSVQGILAAQETGARIIRQLLLFSQKKIESKKVVDFGMILKGIQPLLKQLTGATIEMEIVCPSDPVLVSADAANIEQIIMNLAINARDAMPQGGKLEIRLEATTLLNVPHNVRIAVQPGQFALLTVKDTGTGMPDEVFQKIFEPFFTTKEVGKGTGLGLAVIYGILSQAGGTLSVESSMNVGTTFKIFWPQAEEESTASSLLSLVAGQAPAARKTKAAILLVEDEESFRRPLVATLTNQGYVVIEAKDGEEAFQIISGGSVEIDLVVTDVVMPRMGGPVLAKKIREISPQMNVLFLSGYVDETIDDYKIDTATTWFLAKPFTTKTLIEKIRTVLSVGPKQAALKTTK